MSDEQKSGTTADGNATATGTTVDGNAELAAAQKRIEELERQKQQHLAEKSKAEANARRVAELEARLTSPAQTAAPNPMRVQAMLAEDIALAQQGDEGAQYRVWLAQMGYQGQQIAQQSQAELMKLRELLSIPESDRETVETLSNEHGVSPKVARLILEGQRASEAEKRLKAREAELLAQTERKPVATAAIGLTAAETQAKTMKRSEFNATVRKLEAEGRGAEADALIRREDSGELSITPG